MSDLNALIIVKCNESVKKHVMQQAKDKGTTISEIIRDFLDSVNSGRIKPLLKFEIEHPLEPGTYAFIPIHGGQEQ